MRARTPLPCTRKIAPFIASSLHERDDDLFVGVLKLQQMTIGRPKIHAKIGAHKLRSMSGA